MYSSDSPRPCCGKSAVIDSNKKSIIVFWGEPTCQEKLEEKKESENWIPTDARPFLFLFRIVLFLASQPLTDSSICRLLSQPVLLCQTACMANLRQYSRLQIGDSHAHSVETLRQTKHYGYYYVLKQKTFSVQIYVIIKKNVFIYQLD